MKRIAVFFDTNVIESRFSHEKHEFLFHEEIKPNSLFYQPHFRNSFILS